MGITYLSAPHAARNIEALRSQMKQWPEAADAQVDFAKVIAAAIKMLPSQLQNEATEKVLSDMSPDKATAIRAALEKLSEVPK